MQKPRKKTNLERFKVPPENLCVRCSADEIGVDLSTEAEPLTGFIGQERAHRAFTLGLKIKGHGYNIYASGPPGTGKRTMIQEYLKKIAKDLPTPDDWCYVYNFDDPIQPQALSLPPGWGKKLKADLGRLVKDIQGKITKFLESEEFQKEQETIFKEFEEKREALLRDFQKRARDKGFLVQFTPKGVMMTPHISGKPLRPEEFEALPESHKKALSEAKSELERELKSILNQLRQMEKETNERAQELERSSIEFLIEPLYQELLEVYRELPHVIEYLKRVQQDMVENFHAFKPQPQPPIPIPLPPAPSPLKRYQVNVIVDNSGLKGAPVIFEPVPNYANLVGRIEKEVHMGAMHTDFTMIHAGSLHKANGGFLVIEMEELLRHPYAYPALKKALKTNQILIEDLGETLGLLTTRILKPKPIPLDVKVILTGSPFIYFLAYNVDEDFRELFKVRADFGTTMDRTTETVKQYVAFISGIVQKEGLLPFSRDALGQVIELSSRLVEDQKKLSTKFSEIVDILRESDFWARQENSDIVTREHVLKAIEEKRFRSNLIEERIHEMIKRGMFLVEVKGKKIGVVNGLSVIDLGDFTFGRPVRISATVGAGKDGVIDIEREVGLGGKIHSKGVLILSGYLRETFATKHPLSLSARLVFEQSYSEVEGDSASSTELYALMSALSELPIRQDIAVTGSVNQKGELQPVGGINEKIEGFFRTCKVKGLTRTQGVIIPKRNLDNLMLHDDVIKAVEDGTFHIYAIETIEEGIEILTGVPAGRKPDGTFETGSVFDRIAKRLMEFQRVEEETKPRKKPTKKKSTRKPLRK